MTKRTPAPIAAAFEAGPDRALTLTERIAVIQTEHAARAFDAISARRAAFEAELIGSVADRVDQVLRALTRD